MTESEMKLLRINARAAAREVALTIFVRELSKQRLHPELLRRCIAELLHIGTERTIPGDSADSR